MKKKILSLALALVLVLALVPVAATAVNTTVIVPFGKYDDIGRFSEGLVVVGVDGKYGFIDKTGKEVVPPKYDWAESFSDGLAVVRVGDWETGKWGVIDKTGKEIVPPKYDSVGAFSEGLAGVMLNGKYGFIDMTGKEVVPLKYGSIEAFSDGLAAVKLGDVFSWGFIDKTGKEVVPPKYGWAGSFSEGLAGVGLDGKYGFIDKTGKEVVPLKYDNVGAFSEGLAAVCVGDWETGYKWGFIDKTGKEIVSPKYDWAGSFTEGFARVMLDGKGGFIDMTGKEIVPPKYDDLWDFSNGVALVWLGDWGTRKLGFIDTTGKEIVPVGKYDTVSNFSDGFALVGLDGKLGFIDTTGKEVVPPKYNRMYAFSGGMAVVADSDWNYLIIDIATDKEVDTHERRDDILKLFDGVATVWNSSFEYGVIALLAADPLDTADTWAHVHINEAIEKGFLPASLQGDYKAAITRGEFVTLAMSWLRYHTGLTDAQLVEKYAVAPERTFSDTDDPVILAAGKLDITAGIGGGLFGTETTFDRQSAATMLVKVHNILNQAGGSFNTASPPSFGWADIDTVSEWARNAVNFAGSNGVMSGSGGKFDPFDTFSRQHSITVFNNIDRRENK